MSNVTSAFIEAPHADPAPTLGMALARPAFRAGTGWLHALSRALDQVPSALVLTGERGEIVEVNAAARRLLDERDGVSVRGNHLVLSRGADQHRLRMLLAASRLASEAAQARPQGLAARRPSGAHAYYLKVSSLTVGPLSKRPFIARIDIIDLSQNTRLDARMLHDLFELTPREVELAQALAEGCSLAEASPRMGICHETVRSHLKQMFQKTRTCRQAQLVRLLLLCARGSPSPTVG